MIINLKDGCMIIELIKETEHILVESNFNHVRDIEFRHKINIHLDKICKSIKKFNSKTPIKYIGIYKKNNKETIIHEPIYILGDSEEEIQMKAELYETEYEIFPIYFK